MSLVCFLWRHRSWYRWITRFIALLLGAWSVYLAYPMLIFRDFPHMHARYYGAFLVLIAARFVEGMSRLFDENDPPDGGSAPLPEPVEPDVREEVLV